MWKQILRYNFVQWGKLADFLELNSEQRAFIAQSPSFPLNLPLRLAQKIRKGTLKDPILQQFLPTLHEEKDKMGFALDPVLDQSFRKSSKLLHKYCGRVLLVCTSACAMNCRFCFRQNFEYETEEKGFSNELELISQDESIREVILSGGDPLSLADHTLQDLLCKLDAIPHIHRIRFHTRFPIGIPERIDDNFLEVLKKISKRIWFVIHVNHPMELDDAVWRHLELIQKMGITILSQTVLLKNVNDDPDILKDLWENLVDHGVMPYYLHQLDRVRGAAHFEVLEERGKEIMQKISGQISGYALPKYVKEVPGELGKKVI